MQKVQVQHKIEIFINSFESLSKNKGGVNEYHESNQMLNILNTKHSQVDEIVKIDINQEIVEANWFATTKDKSEHKVSGLRKKVQAKYDLVRNDLKNTFVLP